MTPDPETITLREHFQAMLELTSKMHDQRFQAQEVAIERARESKRDNTATLLGLLALGVAIWSAMR